MTKCSYEMCINNIMDYYLYNFRVVLSLCSVVQNDSSMADEGAVGGEVGEGTGLKRKRQSDVDVDVVEQETEDIDSAIKNVEESQSVKKSRKETDEKKKRKKREVKKKLEMGEQAVAPIMNIKPPVSIFFKFKSISTCLETVIACINNKLLVSGSAHKRWESVLCSINPAESNGQCDEKTFSK